MIPAVAYYRMSDKQQELSIEEQRAEVTKLAKNKKRQIIREYIDEAISGDETEKRYEFQRMVRDANDKADFQEIFCWNQDRFGRFDMLDAGYWIKPLRDAGVRLVTVAQGEIDWNDFAGRVIYGIQQEGKNQFLVDLSHNVARGLKHIAEQGFLPSGAIPYGFDRLVVDAQGIEQYRVRFGEKGLRKQKEWRSKLVISEDTIAVDTVKWLFREYANTERGLQSLCDELNAQGVPSPNGTLWQFPTVRNMFMNRAYIGDLVYGRKSHGKYHTVNNGEIKSVPRRAKKFFKPEDQWIITSNAHKAIIDLETWEAVHAKLRERSQHGSVAVPKKHGDKYILRRLLYCGHCGKRMHANLNCGHVRYMCQTYNRHFNNGSCGAWSVRQDALLLTIAKLFEKIVFADGNEEMLSARVREQLLARNDSNPADIRRLEQRVGVLERDIKQAADRLLRCPDDITDLLAPQISGWRREQKTLQAKLTKLRKRSTPTGITSETEAVVTKLVNLRDELKKAKPERLRFLWNKLIHRIDFWWKPKKTTGTRRRYSLDRGTIQLGVAVVDSASGNPVVSVVRCDATDNNGNRGQKNSDVKGKTDTDRESASVVTSDRCRRRIGRRSRLHFLR